MSVILNPYKGINFYNNDILFGMTQKDVKKILKENAPKIEIDHIMEEIREYRLGMIFTFIEKKLSDITFSLHVDLHFEGINIFENEHVISELSKYDTPTSESKGGYINFYKLGISLGGFGKRKIPEKKLATAFSRERIKFYESLLKV